MILAYDILNHVEIYRGDNPMEVNRAIESYCEFMGITDKSVRVQVIY